MSTAGRVRVISERLRALYRPAGTESSAGVVSPIDWAEVEAAVGFALPSDWKEFCDFFPPGRFEYLGIVHLREQYGDWYELTGAACERFADSADSVPFSVTPGPGGLVVWGTTDWDPFFCWLAVGDDPDSWSTAIIEDTALEWVVIDRPMIEVVDAIVFGDLSVSMLEGLFSPTPVEYYVIPDQEIGPPEMFPPVVQHFEVCALREPVDEVDSVLAVLGCDTGGRVSPRDWAEISRRYGMLFPADYRRLVDSLPGLVVGGVTLTVPDHEDPEHDWATLVRSVGSHAESLWLAEGTVRAVYPQERGLIPWGSTGIGELLCWTPNVADPDAWPVVVLAPDWHSGGTTHLSTSTFVRRRLERRC